MTDWPSNVKAFRARHRLSQEALAAHLSDGKRTVVARTVQYWESGKRTPPPYLKRALRDLARELTMARPEAAGQNQNPR